MLSLPPRSASRGRCLVMHITGHRVACSLASGVVLIDARPDGCELLEAVGDAEDAHRRGRTEAARSVGMQAAAAMRERKRRTKLERARQSG